jgi:hypothetical protein
MYCGRFALSHRLEKVSVLPIVPTPPKSATAHDWELTYPCMALLRIIHTLNDEHFTLYPSMAHRLELMRSEDMAILPASSFLCEKLAQKVRQHLEDPLTVGSQVFPDWLHWVMMVCPFLFPLSLRHLYFRETAFGGARALHALDMHLVAQGRLVPIAQRQTPQHQQQHASLLSSFGLSMARPENPETRLSHIKVRVRRDRVLDAAVQLTASRHAHERSQWRAEFVGEVGVGLGPTLEFFTLLSHELQRKDLLMWTDEQLTTQTTALPSSASTLFDTAAVPASSPNQLRSSSWSHSPPRSSVAAAAVAAAAPDSSPQPQRRASTRLMTKASAMPVVSPESTRTSKKSTTATATAQRSRGRRRQVRAAFESCLSP